MNTEALFLFLILLLGLLLCSFLGGNCGKEGFDIKYTSNPKGGTLTVDGSNNIAQTIGSIYRSTTYDNYNHYTGSSSKLEPGSKFTSTNGGSIVVNTDSNGQQSLQVTLADGKPMTFSSKKPSSKEGYTNYYGNNGSATKFYGPNGATATVVTGDNGQQAINIKTSSGSYTYTKSGSSYYNPNNISSTQYYGSTGYPVQQAGYSLSYNGPYGGSTNYAQGPYGGSAGSVTGPQGNTAYYAEGPQGNAVGGTSSGGYGDQYYSTMPQGIPKSQIPSGQEDLYILKSQVVPPVCPACPSVSAGSSGCGTSQEKCPPCPACARCPEPSFECKKVPNYNAIGSDYLPAPVLSDFSSFGM